LKQARRHPPGTGGPRRPGNKLTAAVRGEQQRLGRRPRAGCLGRPGGWSPSPSSSRRLPSRNRGCPFVDLGEFPVDGAAPSRAIAPGRKPGRHVRPFPIGYEDGRPGRRHGPTPAKRLRRGRQSARSPGGTSRRVVATKADLMAAIGPASPIHPQRLRRSTKLTHTPGQQRGRGRAPPAVQGDRRRTPPIVKFVKPADRPGRSQTRAFRHIHIEPGERESAGLRFSHRTGACSTRFMAIAPRSIQSGRHQPGSRSWLRWTSRNGRVAPGRAALRGRSGGKADRPSGSKALPIVWGEKIRPCESLDKLDGLDVEAVRPRGSRKPNYKQVGASPYRQALPECFLVTGPHRLGEVDPRSTATSEPGQQSPEVNVITVEDPGRIPYRLPRDQPGAGQSPKPGLTFAPRALRSNPAVRPRTIVLLGEIR